MGFTHKIPRLSCSKLGLVLLLVGCARLFGWEIHAPGVLSENFAREIEPLPTRIALYLPPELLNYESRDRGGVTADPQTYHIGESLGPMLLEAFQQGFGEFIFVEMEPSAEMLGRYGIPYLAVVRIKEFRNRVTWRGQRLTLVTETAVLDPHLQLLDRFQARGTSEAQKVFAKKGGPEVNLNAALENNALAIVHHLQDSIRTGWRGIKSP